MAIAHSDMEEALKTLECRTNFKVKKITEYMLPSLKEPFYLCTDNHNPQLIIRPAFEVFANELSGLDGVSAKYSYYHNADMTRFPTRVNTGRTEVHYGLAFEFEHTKAVKTFIETLINIAKGS